MRRLRGAPSHIDLIVGQQIRRRRVSLKLSLEGLAANLGISHQQLQKYETGASRITITMLHQIAVELRVPVTSLWLGTPTATEVAWLNRRQRDTLSAFLSTPDGASLAAAFVLLPETVQRQFTTLICALVEDTAA